MSPTPTRRVLITGATGFIGSHLVRHVLGEGHEVIALVRQTSDLERVAEVEDRIALIRGDMGRLEAVAERIRREAPDLCLDAAWSSPRSRSQHGAHLGSLRNSLHLAQLMVEVGCSLYLHTGTCFEYDVRVEEPLSESSPTAPHTLYGACKRALFTAVEKLGEVSGGLRVAWPRIFYVYGPREAPARLVPSVIRGLLSRRETPTSGGRQVRDYMHVEDVASAVWAVAQSDHRGPVNVASGRAVTVRDVVERIGELVGAPEHLRIGALPYRPDEPPSIRADVTLLSERIGWEPSYTLESGLEKTVRWWEGRGEGEPGP